ncbi:hypothetical protein [Geodermatophilus chilensis]|uniref:hypothetical protein n=1 Tax=Geodermatophilus chilensis TaxID=2035835 RepID=UPI0012FFFB32|nr:hypothetical protein [Geodermatophilus chilensis]
MSGEVPTTEQLLDAIASALRARDLHAVRSLLHALAVRDPHAAQTVLDAIEMAEAVAR